MPDGLMDPLALFTKGEFRSEPSPQPELLLYDHGEFPRTTGGVTILVRPDPGGSGGRRRGRMPKPDPREITDEELAIIMLFLDE